MEEKGLRQDVFNRLSKFKEVTGLNLNAFAGRIGMKHATLHNQFHGKRELSLDTVINTLSAYKELSAEWLLRGNEEMFITNETKDEVSQKHEDRLEALIDTITLLQETIKTKNATIDALQSELAHYKNQVKKA